MPRCIADAAYRAFLNSAAWKRTSKRIRLERSICQHCNFARSEHVHHVKPWAQCTPEEALDDANLMALCAGCHNIVEAATPAAQLSIVTGQSILTESEHIKYDPKRGTFIEKFSAKFCNHYRGSIASQPFVLHPKQTEQLHQVYGMIDQRSGRRHVTEWYWESAIGTGKTPLMAVCGLAELLASGENGAQIYSLSNTFKQASYSFETAKLFIKNNPLLQDLVRRGYLIVNQRVIIYRPTDSKWEITSGTGTKAGDAASLLLVDEVTRSKIGTPTTTFLAVSQREISH